MKKLVFAIVLMASLLNVQAQDNSNSFKMFNHLDLGVTLGTTGFGIDAAMPVGDYVKLRTGFEVMPRYVQDMHFDIESFNEGGITSVTSIEKISKVMYDMTGYRINNSVKMESKPTMWNFKFLVDIYPFKNNKHWHFTAGFHWGPSKIAEAINSREDGPSLFSVGMYNHFYDIAWDNYHGIPTPLIIEGYDELGQPYGPSLDPSTRAMLLKYGRLGIHIGNYSHDITDKEGNVIYEKGSPYLMEANEDGMVYADVFVNNFKPYLGFGYEGRLIKGNDNYKIGFDAGVMFWGGKPSIITHDGTDLVNDVEDINGKVGDYVKLINGVKAYPVINLRITRTIF